MGLTLIGGVSGSIMTYALDSSYREQELQKTQENLKKEIERNRYLCERIEEKNDRAHALFFSLRDVDQANNDLIFALNTCRAQRDFVRYAFENSFCFLRQKCHDDFEMGSPLTKKIERTKNETVSPTR